jgi:hypothetical protein
MSAAGTPYGFVWGDVEVERTASVTLKRGTYRVVTIHTKRRRFEVTITPSGLIRTLEVPLPKATN